MIAFFGALRLSEIVPVNKRGGSCLLSHHVVVGESSVRLCIAKSKTDQLGRVVWIDLFSCLDPAI